MTEDEMVAWHYQLNGHEFEQAPGAGFQSGWWTGSTSEWAGVPTVRI